MEKGLRFQERKRDRDSAISIGSPSTGPPSHRQSIADRQLDSGLASRKDSTDSTVYVLAEKQDQKDSPLGESGIGLSIHGWRVDQDLDKHTDTDTQTH